MKRYITLCGKEIEYTLDFKRVKNINLRIKRDGVFVSASKRVQVSEIERFMKSKERFILKALDKFQNITEKERVQYFTELELKNATIEICKRIHPYFENRGVKYPIIKFRKMVSQWGSCNFVKGIVTFNTALIYVPYECVEYVVLHEFCHFLEANHSKRFYDELYKVCPKYKDYKKFMNGVSIR